MRAGLAVVITLIGTLLPVVVGVAALTHAARQHRMRRRLLPATGVVTDVRVRVPDHAPDEASLPLQFPTVRFTTPDEQVHEGEVRQAFSWDRHQPGRRVAILYDPADPSSIWPASDAGPLLWGCLGGLFVSVGLFLSLVAAGAGFLLFQF